MNSSNTEIAHDLTKTILREYERYFSLSRSEYDEGYKKSHRLIFQILNLGADPDKLKPILMNMYYVEDVFQKRCEAVERLADEVGEYLGLVILK